MKYLLFSCLISSVLFISCNNDDDSSQEEQLSDPNFYALTVGNSWKYQYFKRINRTGEFESLDAFDDVTITGTSEINGNEYFNFKTVTSGNDSYTCIPDNGTVITKLRDSLGYLINENGLKYFSYSNPNQEYLIRELNVDVKLYGLLNGNDETLEVPAGNFLCSVNKVYARFSDGSTSRGTDYYSYSKEIGQIKTTCSFISDSLSVVEKRLVSYNTAN
jgi:hypothetical protein